MKSQIGWHLSGIAKERGESCAVGLDQRITWIENIERRRAVVSIDYHLNAVPNVVDCLIAGLVMPRIRIVGGFCKSIDDPEEAAVVTDDHIWIVIVNQERRQTVDDVTNVTVNQGAAVRRYVVGKRQLGEIVEGPGEQQSP